MSRPAIRIVVSVLLPSRRLKVRLQCLCFAALGLLGISTVHAQSFTLTKGNIVNTAFPTLNPRLSADLNHLFLLASDIAAGRDYTCAVDKDYGLFCWGNNAFGQIGQDASILAWNTPVPVVDQRGKSIKVVDQVVVGDAHSCYRAAGEVYCWGSNEHGQLGQGYSDLAHHPVPVLVDLGLLLEGKLAYNETAMDIAAGANHTCAALHSGKVKCWRRDGTSLGRVGVSPTNYNPHTPEDFAAAVQKSRQEIRDAVDVMAGFDFSCYANIDGNAWCWGENSKGQHGSGWPSSSNHQAQQSLQVTRNFTEGADEPMPLVLADAGYQHACAIRQTSDGADDRVACWGRNESSERGLEEPNSFALRWARDVPALVNSSIISVAAGGTQVGQNVHAHSCAVESLGRVWCWGDQSEGQVGAGIFAAFTEIPIEVADLQASVVTAGGLHTCATRRADGFVMCWGSNEHGQIGSASLPMGTGARTKDPLMVTIPRWCSPNCR